MEKLTEIISKKVYCLGSGNGLGYVLNVVFDNSLSRIKSIIVVDDDSELEGDIDVKNINIAVNIFLWKIKTAFFMVEKVFQPIPSARACLLKMGLIAAKLGKFCLIILKLKRL